MNTDFLVLSSTDQNSLNRHEFRTNNYFHYLSGYAAHNSIMILGKESADFMLSRSPGGLYRQIYEGGQVEDEKLKSHYLADSTCSYEEAWEMINSLIKAGSSICTDLGNREFLDELERNTGMKNLDMEDARPILDGMRMIKDDLEKERLIKACNITAKSLTRVMKSCEPGMYEFQMEALIEGNYLEYGSAMPGFPSIVASGPNSTILHYEPNNRLMEDGDLLLMDIGADYGYYTADISRTIPVNGKFSPEQKQIYQLVLDAQKAAIEVMQPGKSLVAGHEKGREVMTAGLAELGLITDTAQSWQVEFYCIHGSSHYLGMDVHDVGEYFSRDNGDPLELEPGMVLTIEPGIYVREKGLDQLREMMGSWVDSSEIAGFIETVSPVYGKYLNTGVRIEDDILITETGNQVLSKYAPKEIRDIELLMGE